MHRWLARLAVLSLAVAFIQGHPAAPDLRLAMGDIAIRFPVPDGRSLSGCGLVDALSALETVLAQK